MEKKRFGQYLKELRKGKFTQRQLAKKLDVDFTYISKIENDKMPPPSCNILDKLVELLGADREKLYSMAGKIPPDIEEIIINNPKLMKKIKNGEC